MLQCEVEHFLSVDTGYQVSYRWCICNILLYLLGLYNNVQNQEQQIYYLDLLNGILTFHIFSAYISFPMVFTVSPSNLSQSPQ